MSLFDTLQADLNAARKALDKPRVLVLGTIYSDAKNRKIEVRRVAAGDAAALAACQLVFVPDSSGGDGVISAVQGRPVLVGNSAVLARYGKTTGVEILEIDHPKPKIGEIDAAHGRAAIAVAEAAVRGALAGEFDAVVAAPHTEESIHAAGIAFDGYPSFVARTSP